MRVHVSLVDKHGRKKRSDASADNWSPESGEIRISFEPGPRRPSAAPADSKRQRASEPNSSNPRLADLIRSLDRAESTPGYEFVALRWFRDTVLPAEGFAWARSDAERQTAIREAVEKRVLLTSKVRNPKSPQFPVTAIRLNRLLPEVQSILGNAPTVDPEFSPLEIRGEALSATVLHQRR